MSYNKVDVSQNSFSDDGGRCPWTGYYYLVVIMCMDDSTYVGLSTVGEISIDPKTLTW